jgi:dipeptidase
MMRVSDFYKKTLKILIEYVILYAMIIEQLKQLRRIAVLILFLLPMAFHAAAEENCFTILAGQAATIDGSVMLAHNEDGSVERYFINVRKIPSQKHKSGSTISLKRNGSLAQVSETYGFLWLESIGEDFGDSCFNEKGLTITSNQCVSREDKPELKDGGIGFMLRRLMVERASTARQAVEIAGKLIDKYGYYSSGRTYAIADPNEAWILNVVRGKHWIAKRVPHNHVAVIANRYTIDNIDLKDTKNYLGSPDIVSYAVKRRWYNPQTGGNFNFSKVYSAPLNYSADLNVLRQWRGTNLLAKKKFTVDSMLPFSFIPNGKLTPPILFRVLRDHYEETEYDSTRQSQRSPNASRHMTICNESTHYAFVAQLRKSLPQEYAHLIWISFGRPDSNAFSPWYTSISSPPEGYTFNSSKNMMELHFKPPKTLFTFNPEYAFWYFVKLSMNVDRQYRTRIKMVRKEWRNFENYALKMRKKMEKDFGSLVKRNRFIAQKLINNYVAKLEYRRWFLVSELLFSMR